jgi:sRNA-binding carbon storage regulator CsrA
MLILSRKAGERVKIDCPDGTVIWLTMLEDGIECDDSDLDPLIANDKYGNVFYSYPEGEVEIVYMPKRLKQHHDRVGIIAPKSFLILREELLPDERP